LDTAGAADIAATVPPNSVTVTSQGGGSTEIPVQIQGPGLPPLPLAALAGGDQTVEQGVTVTLDGGASTGNIDSFEWTGPAGITLTGANGPKATFKAPLAAGDYEFTLTVNGTDGMPPAAATKQDTVVVHVREAGQADANIAFAGQVQAAGAT